MKSFPPSYYGEKFFPASQHHSASAAPATRRLYVSSSRSTTRSRWNIDDFLLGSRAPPRGGVEADFHGALKPFIIKKVISLVDYRLRLPKTIKIYLVFYILLLELAPKSVSVTIKPIEIELD